MVHLLAEYLIWLKTVIHVGDVIVDYWVAALTHTTFGDCVFINLEGFFV